MRRIVAIILFLGLLLQTFYALSVVTFYYTRKAYVAKTLCENKNKPQLHCNGKCFLKKKLKEAENESGQSKKSLEKQEQLVLAMPIVPALLSVRFQPTATREVSRFRGSQYRFTYLAACFHPPAGEPAFAA